MPGQGPERWCPRGRSGLAAEKLPLPQHSDGVRNRKELEAVRGVRSRTGKQVRRWLWLTLRPLYTSALRDKAAGMGRNP